MSWTFGDLRDFFHGGEAPDSGRFLALFDAMVEAHARAPGEVEQEWLPYALEQLEGWPDDDRCWDNGAWWEDDADVFTRRSHPLHALGRTLLVEEGDARTLHSYSHAPDVGGLVSLRFSWLEGVDAPALERALEGLKRADLRRLGLAYMELDDACAAALSAAAHLSGLTSLDISGHAMSRRALTELARAPHMRGLRDLSFGDIKGERTPRADLQIELMESLPELVTTLTPHNATRPDRRRGSWDGIEPGYSGRSVRERVERALSIYRAPNEGEGAGYPFLGEAFCCHGGYAEVSAEDFAREDLTLHEAYPRSREVEESGSYDVSTLYVVVTREGALDEAFDEEGALIAPLSLRTMGRNWMEPPAGREQEGYAGACFLQSVFASNGLCLDEDEPGVLRLTPAGWDRESALVRYWRAHHVAQEWAGGWLLDYCCSPWYEPLGGEVDSVKVRASIVWEERAHRFGRRGELTEGQEVMVSGDGVAWVRVLRGSGFEVEAGSREDLAVLVDRRAQEAPSMARTPAEAR